MKNFEPQVIFVLADMKCLYEKNKNQESMIFKQINHRVKTTIVIY